MALSSGTRSLLGEVAAWGTVGAMCVGMIAYFDEMQGALRAGLGVPPVEQSGEATPTGAEVAAKPADQGTGGYSVELRANDIGHFHTPAEVNGREIEVMVDTGASMVALTYDDASRAGIFLNDADFTGKVSTANGTARVAPVHLDRVTIGDITVRGVDAVVAERGNLDITLLGMTFLSRLDRVDMRSGVLMLHD
jgi:aspartyl protease family protein